MSVDDSAPVDVVVVGAGVLGCAVARTLSIRGLQVYVLESREAEGQGLTSRNSGVVHSGIYYPHDSLKARSCVQGQRMLWDWVQRKDVPHRMTGKLVVARRPEELNALDALYGNARASGARGVQRLSSSEVSALEPDLPKMVAALHCPYSGIVDAVALTHSLRV
ncbi:MAG: FAD-dependent oxidoreductase, partial [Myxococcota bacterium]|nr:FAD-dependent oxidoreductase [Myxococcota bacterium]